MSGKSPDLCPSQMLQPMQKIFSTFLAIATLTLISGCISIERPHTRLAPGLWRGILKLDASQASRLGGSTDQTKSSEIVIEEVTAGELPIMFEVVYTSPDSFYIVWINGTERIETRDIRYGLDRATAKDTLRIDFPLMDTYIEAICEEGVIQGKWVVPYKDDYSIPFEAKFGVNHRFTPLRKTPSIDLTGEWAVAFEPGTENAYPAIAEFRADGNHLTGTFRTETGDYRFLEGTVQSNKLYLSCFDGSHAFLFEGKILEDNSIQGTFRSGTHYQAYWEANRQAEISLKDPHSLTSPSKPEEQISFTFPSPDGKMISNHDPEFSGKPMIIQILGTWCPNCLDETQFLKGWIQANPASPVKVIGLCFERYEETKSLDIIRRYREKLDVPYPLLYAGNYQKKIASTHVPFLSDIKAYPTMIFLDKSHKIVKIHTGFDGPATSKYDQFTTDFHNFVRQLAASQ